LSLLYRAVQSSTEQYRAVQSSTEQSVFKTKIVSTTRDPVACFAGINIFPHQSIFDLQNTDIIYFSPVAKLSDEILDHKNQEIMTWVRKMYQQGATVCASGSGSLILAEMGLLDGLEATTHWTYVDIYRRRYPQVILCENRTLVQTGEGQKLVTTSGAWQDLVLYLIARYAGTEAAIQIAKIFLIQWNLDNLELSFASFQDNLQNSDALIQTAQKWLAQNFHQPNVVSAAVHVSGLTSRTFNRRFKQATGFTPIAYTQNLRIEQAKIHLEITDKPIDAIGAAVGYEDSSFFRLLFQRVTGLTPSAYRRKFKGSVANNVT
jgi:transcriptional regulator GlxA family with amidase domain